MLRPHQVQPAAHLLAILQHSNALDASDMGIGKTHVAAWVASQLKLPALVVCPDIQQSAWHRAAAAEGDTLSVINYESLRTGKSPYGEWSKPAQPRKYVHKCVNCQVKFEDGKPLPPCYCRPDGIHSLVTVKVSQSRGRFSFHPNVRAVIWDEVHRCNAVDSLNADMLIAAVRQNLTNLMLSATPAHSPLHFRAIGYALRLHGLSNFYSWAMSKGIRRIPGQGFIWAQSKLKQQETMRGIHAEIFPSRGVRIRKEDIPDFPEVSIRAELYDLKEYDRIDMLYAKMHEALKELKGQSSYDKDSEHPLTKRLRLRQEIELLKVPIAVQLARDAVEKGRSVALFVNFTATLKELSERLGTRCVLDGTTGGRERDCHIANFQRNEEKIILVNIKVGGVALSLPDLTGDNPRLGLTMPTDSAVDMEQIFGRLPRHGGKSKSDYILMLAAGTCEEKIYSEYERHSGNLKALCDAVENFYA